MENFVWHTKYARTGLEVRKQMENLDLVAERLRFGEESVALLLDERHEMCPMCREIIEGVVGEKDKETVKRRINNCLMRLAEQTEKNHPGLE